MIHLRRSCVCMRLPNCRPVRLKLWFLLIAVVIIFFAVNLLVNFMPRWVESKDGVDSLPVNWLWQQGLNPISKPTNGLTKGNKGEGHSKELHKEKSDTQTGPCVWFPGNRLPHKIWDTNLRHTDRIEEQLNYLPKRRRLFSSAHILVWNKGGGEQIPPGNVLFKSSHCLVDNCNIILDPATDLHVDALVTSVSISDHLLLKRKPDDVYVFYQLESPMSFFPPEEMSGFNWTATYRHDSTIVTPYEKWVHFRQNTSAKGIEASSDDPSLVPPTGRNYAAGKTKMAAALISNCVGGRLRVIEELTKFIQVDVYGGCGLTCEGDCLSMIHQDYKFYLAFENANCEDYITEKFFRNALSANIVPVVYGAPPSDYARAAPPHSYIHVDDYPTVRHLATYLQDLDENDDLYNAYFKWKGTGYFINTKFWCRLCAMVNDLDKPHLSIPDIGTWFVENACEGE